MPASNNEENTPANTEKKTCDKISSSIRYREKLNNKAKGCYWEGSIHMNTDNGYFVISSFTWNELRILNGYKLISMHVGPSATEP